MRRSRELRTRRKNNLLKNQNCKKQEESIVLTRLFSVKCKRFNLPIFFPNDPRTVPRVDLNCIFFPKGAMLNTEVSV